MIYRSGREAYNKELKQFGFTTDDAENIYSKIGDFYVVLFDEDELERMAEAKQND